MLICCNTTLSRAKPDVNHKAIIWVLVWSTSRKCPTPSALLKAKWFLRLSVNYFECLLRGGIKMSRSINSLVYCFCFPGAQSHVTLVLTDPHIALSHLREFLIQKSYVLGKSWLIAPSLQDAMPDLRELFGPNQACLYYSMGYWADKEDHPQNLEVGDGVKWHAPPPNHHNLFWILKN